MKTNIPDNVPPAAVTFFRQIHEYYDPAHDSDLSKTCEIFGEIPLRAFENTEPLLAPIDLVGLTIAEKRGILFRRFMPPGRMKCLRIERDMIERMSAVLTIIYHTDLLQAAGVLPTDRELDHGVDRVVVMRAFDAWYFDLMVPLLAEFQLVSQANPEWRKGIILEEIPVIDRATRLAQLYTQQTWRSGVFGRASNTVASMKKALRMHEAYKPKCLREGVAIFGPGAIAGPARMAMVMERKIGFEDFMVVNKHGQMLIDPYCAKDEFDDWFGRTAEDQAEHRTYRDADLTADDEESLGSEALEGRIDPHVAQAGLAIEEANGAVERSALAVLFADVIDALAARADTDADDVTTFAAELARVIELATAQSDPGLRAGILSAWIRGKRYRGAITREAIAAACGVSVPTVRRRETEGARLLALT